MEILRTNIIRKKTKKQKQKLSRYFDVDGACLLVSSVTLSKHLDSFQFLSLSVKWETFSVKKCLNKNLLYFQIEDKNFKLSNFFQFYIGSQDTVIGKFDFFILIKNLDYDHDIEKILWNNLIESCRKTPFHSYYNSFSKYRFINFTVNRLIHSINKIEQLLGERIYLYGEKYGMKTIIKSKNTLLSLLNNDLNLFSLKSYMFDYFDFDLCKNIRMKTKLNNITTVKFKKDRNGRNIFERSNAVKLYNYNQLNNSKINDYHSNNCDISVTPGSIGINKLNFYLPLMNNIVDSLYKKKEIYNKKFVHDVLYTANNIQLTTLYKKFGVFRIKNIKDLIDQIKNFRSNKIFYRIELRFWFNNKNRNFLPITKNEVNNIFAKFNLFSSKTMSYRIYPYKKYKMTLYSNSKRLLKLLSTPSTDFLIVAKKIAANLLFFEFFIRGGTQLHYLKNISWYEENIQKNARFNEILYFLNNFIEDYGIALDIVKSYINHINIRNADKLMFNEIVRYFNRINIVNWKKNCIDIFLEISSINFSLSIDQMLSSSSHRDNYVIENTISSDSFWNNFFIDMLNLPKKSLQNVYYRNLISAMKILRSVKNFDNLDITFLFREDIFSAIFIPIKNIENIIYFIKVGKNTFISVKEFRNKLTEGIIMRAASHKAFIDKSNGKFQFTTQVKLLFKYLSNNMGYSNEAIKKSTNIPLWLLFGVKTRFASLKRISDKMALTPEERDIIPAVFTDPENNIISFISNNYFFHKKINIANNTEFVSLIKFLILLNDDNYNLSIQEYKLYSKFLKNLKFEEISQENIILNNETDFTRDDIILVSGLILDYLNAIKYLEDRMILFTFNNIYEFIKRKLKNDIILNKKDFSNFIKKILLTECFKKHFTIEIREDGNNYYYLK